MSCKQVYKCDDCGKQIDSPVAVKKDGVYISVNTLDWEQLDKNKDYCNKCISKHISFCGGNSD